MFDFKKAVGGSKGLVKYRKGELYADMDCTPYDIRLSNNVKFQFLHEGLTSTVKMCHLWFHTGFVARNYLVFTKSVVDKASKDKKGHYHPAFALEFFLHRVAALPSGVLEESGEGGAASPGGKGAAARPPSASMRGLVAQTAPVGSTPVKAKA